jgi:hypothetical protein
LQAQRGAVVDLAGDLALSRSKVEQDRQQGMLAPELPEDEIRAAMTRHDVGRPQHDSQEAQKWAKLVAVHRAHFAGTAIVVSGPSSRRYFWFLFAMQSPYVVAFAPLREIEQVLPCIAGSSRDMLCQEVAGHFQRNFVIQWGQYMYDDEINVAEDEQVSVLPQLAFLQGSLVASHADEVSLEAFVADFPAPSRAAGDGQPHQRKKEHKTPKVPDEVFKAHPWLAGFAKAERPSKEEKDGRPPDRHPAEVVDVDEEECRRIMLALAEKREDFANEEGEGVEGEDFVCVITGGTWCKVNLGVDFDAVRAKSKVRLQSSGVARGGCHSRLLLHSSCVVSMGPLY